MLHFFDFGEISGEHKNFGGVEPSRLSFHCLVENAVVLDGGFPAHPTDHAYGFHAYGFPMNCSEIKYSGRCRLRRKAKPAERSVRCEGEDAKQRKEEQLLRPPGKCATEGRKGSNVETQHAASLRCYALQLGAGSCLRWLVPRRLCFSCLFWQ